MVHVEDPEFFAQHLRTHFMRSTATLQRRRNELLHSLLQARLADETQRQVRSVSHVFGPNWLELTRDGVDVSSSSLVSPASCMASECEPLPRHVDALYQQRLQVARSLLQVRFCVCLIHFSLSVSFVCTIWLQQVAFKLYLLRWLLRRAQQSLWWMHLWTRVTGLLRSVLQY